jgi:hypothetical protein
VNGIHDMGGVDGFGTVQAEENEPVFHSEWERRTFALAVALGVTGEWTLDVFRHARESVPPAEYLGGAVQSGGRRRRRHPRSRPPVGASEHAPAPFPHR